MATTRSINCTVVDGVVIFFFGEFPTAVMSLVGTALSADEYPAVGIFPLFTHLGPYSG